MGFPRGGVLDAVREEGEGWEYTDDYEKLDDL